MARAGDRSVRDCLVWAFIIGGHALLILVFMGSKQRQVLQVSADTPSPGVLVLIDMPAEAAASAEPVSEPPQLTSVPVIVSATDRSRQHGDHAAARDRTGRAGHQRHRLATGSRTLRARHRRAQCEEPRETHRRASPSPFREKPKPKEFPWDPEPDKAGLAAGFIPYVVIGERCVVGLGFFGCALGKKPPPNSHLFDGMHDPNRQRSSVPEIDTSSALDPPPD